ncbi:MAG: TIGR00153 family protein [Chlamydiales bacterium]
MFTILNLFGRSPFAPLKAHMDKVSECVHSLIPLFSAIQESDFQKAEELAKLISKFEHEADLTKNEIRNHLPNSYYLPIDRASLLEILSLQDSLADVTEDVAVLATLKPLNMVSSFSEEFRGFLEKSLLAFDGVHSIMNELHELLESSFGGIEAEKVRGMVDDVAYKEHEVDLLQRELFKKLIDAENEMSYSTYHRWIKIFSSIASLSDISEKLAFRVRMTLDLK